MHPAPCLECLPCLQLHMGFGGLIAFPSATRQLQRHLLLQLVLPDLGLLWEVGVPNHAGCNQPQLQVCGVHEYTYSRFVVVQRCYNETKHHISSPQTCQQVINKAALHSLMCQC